MKGTFPLPIQRLLLGDRVTRVNTERRPGTGRQRFRALQYHRAESSIEPVAHASARQASARRIRRTSSGVRAEVQLTGNVVATTTAVTHSPANPTSPRTTATVPITRTARADRFAALRRLTVPRRIPTVPATPTTIMPTTPGTSQATMLNAATARATTGRAGIERGDPSAAVTSLSLVA